MGRVYRARQLSLDRIVALKVISTGEMAEPHLVDRFRTEAEAAASLDHPNIVSIYEVGEQDGWNFFSMHLVEGQTLTQALTAGPLPFERAGRLLATLARAIQHAHERGVLHRDLKPANILLDTAGTPYVADFGLAKFTQRPGNLTLTQTVLGTPAYMSPEQAAGHVAETTTAADIYGLGAVMFEMLTGGPPFTGETPMAIARRVIEEEPRLPSSVNPAVPLDLAVICLKCLEKEPGRRYSSAAELADDLERWLRCEPIRARQASMVERVAKWTRRNPRIAALLVLLYLVFISALGVGIWMSHRIAVAKNETEKANVRLAKDLRDLQWQKLEELAAAGKRLDALAYLSRFLRDNPKDEVAATRVISMLSLRNFILRSGKPLEHDGPVNSAAFSTDGERVLSPGAGPVPPGFAPASRQNSFGRCRTVESALRRACTGTHSRGGRNHRDGLQS
jgi:serine/threonine-protein kinase